MKHIRETSNKIAELIITTAGVSSYYNLMKGDNFPYKTRLLEPSAGKGKLIDTLFDNYSFEKNEIEIDCVELNKENCDILRAKGYNTYQMDFINYSSDYNKHNYYDFIIACPPFKDNIDLEHIKKMYELACKKGTIVTLTSPLWISNNETKHIEFRKWLEDKEYYFKMLPDNSFMEKGKTQPTGILKIIKR